MTALHQIMRNPHLTGHALVRPALFVEENIKMTNIATTVTVVVLALLLSPVIILSFAIGMAVKTVSHFRPAPSRQCPLFIHRVDPENYPAVAAVARRWAEEAEVIGTSYGLSEEVTQIFLDSQTVNERIAELLESKSPKIDELYVCKDGPGQEQGLLLIHMGIVITSIVQLATNPHNIRCPQSKRDANRVEGAGTALVEFSGVRCVEQKRWSVYVHPNDSSKAFFQKCGFEVQDCDTMKMEVENEINRTLGQHLPKSVKKVEWSFVQGELVL